VTAGFQAATTPFGMSETDAAFWIAVNKAKELGENKHELRERATIRREERSKTAEMETVTVSFSFAYKARGQRIFAEPAQIEIANQFAKRVDGDARGTDAARAPAMITVNFTFSQIIPYYPYQIS
jgi:hypothetical protein